MERHAALPHREDGGRIVDIAREIVEEDVSDAPAQHDAGCGPDQEVVDVDRPDRRSAGRPQPLVFDEAAGVPPGEQNAHDVAQPVPVDREGAETQGHRIDLGEGQGGQRQEQFGHG